MLWVYTEPASPRQRVRGPGDAPTHSSRFTCDFWASEEMPRTEQSAWSFWDRAGFACGSHPRTQPQSPEDAGLQNLTIWGRSWAVPRGPGPSPKRARLAPPERRDLLSSAWTRGFAWTPGTGHPSSALETSGCGVQSARVPPPLSALAASPPRPAPAPAASAAPASPKAVSLETPERRCSQQTRRYPDNAALVLAGCREDAMDACLAEILNSRRFARAIGQE